MSLFDDFDRTDRSFSEFAEHRYSYMNRCGRPDAERVRSLLQQWYKDFPENHRDEFLGHFRDTRVWNHDAAVFELLLHAMMKRLGFQVEVHPTVPNGKMPDFKVEAPTPFILEATLLTGVSRAEQHAEAARNKLYDDLNRLVKTSDFCLGISFHGTPTQAPSAKKIARFLHTKLEGLDPVIVAERYFSNVDCWQYPLELGCWIEFRPHPLRPDHDSRDDHKPLGVFSDCYFPQGVQRIVDGVKDKVRRYGDVGQPFVIAVNDFGFPVGDEVACAMSRIWESESARKVSAVAYFWQAHAGHLSHAWMRVYRNPRALFPVEGIGNLPIASLDGTTTLNLGEFFDLEPKWPGTP